MGRRQKNINNGIVFGIRTVLKTIRISNGYGIESKLTDVATKAITDSIIIPEFKQGNYFEGTKKGKRLDCYAGRRINPLLFVQYQQRFRQTDFFSTFVRNLNFNHFIGLTVWAGRAMNTSAAASPIVVSCKT